MRVPDRQLHRTDVRSSMKVLVHTFIPKNGTYTFFLHSVAFQYKSYWNQTKGDRHFEVLFICTVSMAVDVSSPPKRRSGWRVEGVRWRQCATHGCQQPHNEHTVTTSATKFFFAGFIGWNWCTDQKRTPWLAHLPSFFWSFEKKKNVSPQTSIIVSSIFSFLLRKKKWIVIKNKIK